MICAVVKVRAKPGMGDKLVQDFQDYSVWVKANEPGVKVYTLNKDREAADVYWAVEFYDDEAAQALHMQNFQKVAATVGATAAEPPTFQMFDFKAGFTA